jgi:hypothetical protein
MQKRTVSNTKSLYEDIWTEAFQKIEHEIVHNKKDLVEAIETYQKDEVRKSDQNPFLFNLNRKIGLVSNLDQVPSKRLVVQNGLYTIASVDTTFNGEFIEDLIRIIHENRDRIDYVVELGSGIGRHIFVLADKLLSTQGIKQKIEYFSCEYSSSGQEACKKLIKYSNEKNIHVEYFDYMNPDLSFLPKKKNYLFFTFHSIEQIPELKKEVLAEILSVSNQCLCLHAEPVGWQYNKDLIEYRKKTPAGAWHHKQPFLKKKLSKLNWWLFNRCGLSFMKTRHKHGIELEKSDINKSDKVSVNAARLSLERNYNMNLIPLLKTIEKDGLIKIDLERVNTYGKKPFNPTTIIAWHKLKNPNTII